MNAYVHAPATGTHKILVYLRDTVVGVTFACKTDGTWHEGIFDDQPWIRGDRRCDCQRGPLVYPGRDFTCGEDRFLVERIVLWETGETIHAGEMGSRSPHGRLRGERANSGDTE